MGEVYAVELVTRRIQVRLYAAWTQAQNFCYFLMRFSPRRPDQTLLLSPGEVDGGRRQL